MPPIEVFVGLDTLRSGSETISSELPTRAELKAWVAEHDKIEKETEIFDAGEFRKLKKFTKGQHPPRPAISPMFPKMLISTSIDSRCSTEPIPRRHRPNRNHPYDNLFLGQVTTSTSWPLRKPRAPCCPVDMGRAPMRCLGRIPQSQEGPRRIP